MPGPRRDTPGDEGHAEAGAPGEIRLDKWLWHARFCKTRSLAAALVAEGRARVNGVRVSRPGRRVGPGDILTLVQQPGRVRVLRILAPGTRRGPASEAQALYADMDAPPAGGADSAAPGHGPA